MNDLIQAVTVYALPVIFAITLHEAAHAYAAKYFGDNTAYAAGRMSLNPLKHIDPIGTILIPLVLYFSTGGQFLFGYAKPVPIEFGRLRQPKRDMAWVALAGPAANFVMALMWMIFSVLLWAFQVDEVFFLQMAKAGILVNLLLLAFNLLPIPPLDGGRIVISVLPHQYAYKFAKIEPYGFFIVIALALLKVINLWVMPVMLIAQTVLQWMISPLKFLLN
jgi:Zn-dependent protease